MIIIERWAATNDEHTCQSCRQLDGLVFQRGRGPVPPLHERCRCARVVIQRLDPDTLSPGAKIRIAAETLANEAKADRAGKTPHLVALATMSAVAAASAVADHRRRKQGRRERVRERPDPRAP